MSTSSNLARSWSVANFFFGMVMLLPSWLFAQSGTVSTSSFVLTSASLTSPECLSFALNPALLEYLPSDVVLCHSTPSPFGLQDLAFHELKCCVALNNIVHSAFSVAANGSALYREVNAAASTSITLSQLAAIGATLRASQARAEGFEARHSLYLDVGMCLAFGTHGRLAASVSNCTRNASAQNADQEMRLGLGERIADSVECDVDYCVSLNRSAGIALSLRTQVLSGVDVRLACSSVTSTLEADAMLRHLYPIDVILRTSWHADLGVTLGGGFAYSW